MSGPASSSAALPIAYVVLRILIVVNWLGGVAILALLVGPAHQATDHELARAFSFG